MIPQPDIRPVKESGQLYKVFQSYNFFVEAGGEKHFFTVPEGFRHDGASVPRLVWTLIGFLPDGAHRGAALAHDYLYENRGSIGDFEYNREYADKAFLYLLEKSGIKNWHCAVAFRAVRLFGGIYWRE